MPGATGVVLKEDRHGRFVTYTVRLEGDNRVFTFMQEEVKLEEVVPV